MFSILVIVRKKDHLPTDEFRKRWSEEYGALCRKLPQLKSYRQYHLTDKRKDDADEPIDGMALMHFNSKQGMEEAWKSEESARLREELMRETSVGIHQTFIDEIVTVVDSPDRAKFSILVVVRKKEHLSVKEFRRAWSKEYGPIYRRIPQIKAYWQYHLTDNRKDDADEPIDGVAILSFNSKEDMKKAWKEDKEAAELRKRIMRETSLGVHVTRIDNMVTIV